MTETPDAHMVETLRLRTAALHRVIGSNDKLRRENDDLRAALNAAQEHVAYHLRDFRPGADDKSTGDLAVDLATYAGRLKVRAEAAEVALVRVRALAEDERRHLVRWIDSSHLIDLEHLLEALDGKP